jgi:hypothetical protein
MGFSSAKVFTDLGYSFSNVRPGDTSFMVALAPINSASMAHPDGTLVNIGGTVYIMKDGSRKAFSSAQIFYSWGLSFAEVVPGNSFDASATVGPQIQTRLVNQLSI